MGNVRVESKEASMRKCQNAKISAVSMFDTYWTQICWGHTYACLDETHTHTHINISLDTVGTRQRHDLDTVK